MQLFFVTNSELQNLWQNPAYLVEKCVKDAVTTNPIRARVRSTVPSATCVLSMTGSDCDNQSLADVLEDQASCTFALPR